MGKLFGMFTVSRTSNYGGCPCEEAEKKTISVRQEMRLASVDKIKNDYVRRNWIENGTDHRVENGCVVRTVEDEVWVVTLENEEDFVAFLDKHSYGESEGEFVIRRAGNNSQSIQWHIEIYDGYRE